ncbi:translation elongation factor Ts [Candidatus Berkelbacteria bacterium]|nr:translation elongation factor Ts [Candidatus Berkelbacteria bacterium]
MADVSLQSIQALREKTGYGVMDVKKALEEAKGDLTKAEALLSERGAVVAAKKADRATNAGRIETYVHAGKIGVMVEVNSETDFVAKNDEFASFVHDVALQIASMNPQSVPELLKQPFVKDSSKTMQTLLHDMVGKIGENLTIRRFIRYELGGE